jgi:hypothetical protein
MASQGGILFAPVALITVGGIMVYSALKGIGITDVLAGTVGDKLNPKGGSTAPRTATPGSGSAEGVPGAGGALGAPPVGGFGTTPMETEMNRMISLKLRYTWGGGHQRFEQNGPWDCSGAMSWLVHFLGIPLASPITSTGFMTQGKPGRGAIFTIYANPSHVFAVMERGPYAGRSWGTTSRIPSNGGSLAWHDHTKAGFVARHYEGW